MGLVRIKFTGDLYSRVGTFGATVDFQGGNLREFAELVFRRYDIRDAMLDGRGHLFPRARILVNGRYIELLQSWDTPIRDGDTVAFMMPGTFVT